MTIRSRDELCKGIGQLEGGSYEDAVQKFSGVLQKDPNNIYGQTYLGMAYEANGDQADALKYYKMGAANTSRATVRVQLDGEYQKAKAAELCQAMVARIEANPAVPSANKEQP
jgi:tetratricopeptide (TPR) repeat protein